MSNIFDKNLPKTTSYWKKDKIFFIKNTSFFVKLEEGQAMAELLSYAMNDRTTVGLVIDNREAKGAWPNEISQIWESDMTYVSSLKNKKMATLTSSMITTMQTNRLSKEHGMAEYSRAFNSDFNDEVRLYLMA